MIKQRIMPTEIPSSKFVTWAHTTRVIFTVKICIFERSNEKGHFSKTKIYFRKKNYTTIIRTYWATKYESRRENEFWATCHNISNLFHGCWHPLLNLTNSAAHGVSLVKTFIKLFFSVSDRYQFPTKHIAMIIVFGTFSFHLAKYTKKYAIWAIDW